MNNIIVMDGEQLEKTLFNTLEKFYAMREEEQESAKILESDRNLECWEVCDRWAISKGTLNNWVKRGLVKPMKLGRRVLFPMSEVLRVEKQGASSIRRLIKATREEITEAINNYGGFKNNHFLRIGDFVIVCDGCIAIVLKFSNSAMPTLYVVEGNTKYSIDTLKSKTWATDEIVKDVIRAAKYTNIDIWKNN